LKSYYLPINIEPYILRKKVMIGRNRRYWSQARQWCCFSLLSELWLH